MSVSACSLRVVAALITSDGGQRVLVQQRPPGKPRGLLWEFPGGKVEAHESDEEALRREAREELGIELEIGPERFRTLHHYPDIDVNLHVYLARVVQGTPQSRAGQVLREATVADLGTLTFCEADRPLVDSLLQEASEVPGRLGG
jgi:8-oxo-dGTP diphosphatase